MIWNRLPNRVVKIGGSLLELPNLVPCLRDWFSRQSVLGPTWFVVGGGSAVERLRTACRQGQLSESAAHWASIEVMQENTRKIAVRLLGTDKFCRLVDPTALDGARSPHQEVIEFVDVVPFLYQQAAMPNTPPLPCSWDVTSDSIAAAIAAGFEASECVLLKSRLPTTELSLEDLVEDGYVDPFFPAIAGRIPQIRMVDFRSKKFPEVTISGQIVWPNTG